jgi:hypothetical protein
MLWTEDNVELDKDIAMPEPTTKIKGLMPKTIIVDEAVLLPVDLAPPEPLRSSNHSNYAVLMWLVEFTNGFGDSEEVFGALMDAAVGSPHMGLARAVESVREYVTWQDSNG